MKLGLVRTPNKQTNKQKRHTHIWGDFKQYTGVLNKITSKLLWYQIVDRIRLFGTIFTDSVLYSVNTKSAMIIFSFFLTKSLLSFNFTRRVSCISHIDLPKLHSLFSIESCAMIFMRGARSRRVLCQNKISISI